MASRFDAADARPDFLTIRGWDKPAFDSAGLVDAVRHLEHIEDVVEYALDSEEFAEARLARGPDAYGAAPAAPRIAPQPSEEGLPISGATAPR